MSTFYWELISTSFSAVSYARSAIELAIIFWSSIELGESFSVTDRLANAMNRWMARALWAGSWLNLMYSVSRNTMLRRISCPLGISYVEESICYWVVNRRDCVWFASIIDCFDSIESISFIPSIFYSRLTQFYPWESLDTTLAASNVAKIGASLSSLRYSIISFIDSVKSALC